MTDWKGAPTRLTAYLPDDMVAMIQRDAKAKGQSLTIWMRRAAEAALDADRQDARNLREAQADSMARRQPAAGAR